MASTANLRRLERRVAVLEAWISPRCHEDFPPGNHRPEDLVLYQGDLSPDCHYRRWITKARAAEIEAEKKERGAPLD